MSSLNRCQTTRVGTLPGRNPGTRADRASRGRDAVDLGIDHVAGDFDGQTLARLADVDELGLHLGINRHSRRAGSLFAGQWNTDLPRAWLDGDLVRKGGFEPPQPFGYWILSPARLPVPPLSQFESARPGTTLPA